MGVAIRVGEGVTTAVVVEGRPGEAACIVGVDTKLRWAVPGVIPVVVVAS